MSKRQPGSEPAAFHYTASGLPNVWLLNGFTREETPYGAGVRIDDADGLHATLAGDIATGKEAFGPAELRFLRKHLRLSQPGLARLLGCSEQTVARWEKGQSGIDPSAERLIRIVILDRLGEDRDVMAALEELADLDAALHAEHRMQRRGAKWQHAA